MKHRKNAFGSKTDRKIYPVDVQPNRFGNENQPVNLCQDPKLGPGKYEYEETTKMTNNLGPTVVNKNGIMLNRTDERFRAPITVGPPPNYLPTDEIIDSTSWNVLPKPFNAQSSRFEKKKPDEALGPGYYTMSDQPIGRRVRNKPTEPITSQFLSGRDHERVPLRSALNEQKELKRYGRRLQYLQLYY